MKKKITIAIVMVIAMLALTACAQKTVTTTVTAPTEKVTEKETDKPTEPNTDATTAENEPTDEVAHTFEEYVEENGEVIDAIINNTLSNYSEIYAGMKILGKGNIVCEAYRYAEGVFATATSLKNNNDFASLIERAKESYGTLSGVEIEDVVFEYYTYDGELIFSTKNGYEPDAINTIEDFFDIEENEAILNARCEQTVAAYSDTYSDMMVIVIDNDVIEEYYYNDGIAADTSAFANANWDVAITQTKAYYKQLTGIEPTEVVLKYYLYDGTLVGSSADAN